METFYVLPTINYHVMRMDEVTDFHNKEMPKVGSNYICPAVILIDFLL